MNAKPPESEITFDFLQDEAEWTRLLENCRERWSQTAAPLRQVEEMFLELQRQLLREDQPSEEAWDRLLEEFAQLQAQGDGLRPYLETEKVEASLLTSPAGSLGWRDAAAVRVKLDQSLTALLGESISSTELRDALFGVAAKVASKPDFYRPANVPRDKQRSRLRMQARVPHYYTVTEAPPGSEQPKGTEPRLVWKLRLLAEWHLRHSCNAWHIWRERRAFWSDAESEIRDFLRDLFPEPVVSVLESVPAPGWAVIEQDRRSRWVRFKDWFWNATMGLLFPRLRRRPIRKTPPPPMPPPPPPSLPKPNAPSRSVKLSKVPVDRDLWPILLQWYNKCKEDAERLDDAGSVEGECVRGLEDRMAGIEAGEKELERGIDVALLRADSITRDLTKLVEVRYTQIEDMAKSVFKLP